MHECIAEYLIGFYASTVASEMQSKDPMSLALDVEEEKLMDSYTPEGLTEEELDALELSEEQYEQLNRRGDEFDEKRTARHYELEIEVLRAWGGNARVESIGSSSDEHFERTDTGHAMMFGSEALIPGSEKLPMWFPPRSS
jgi:hypothetical protein